MMAENKENGSKTLFDMFHSGLKDQTVGQLIEVDRLPSKEEILDITKNPFETIFIITEDNSIYAAKGDESDAKFNELKPQLDNKKIALIAHTHPFKDNMNKNKSLFFSRSPT